MNELSPEMAVLVTLFAVGLIYGAITWWSKRKAKRTGGPAGKKAGGSGNKKKRN